MLHAFACVCVCVLGGAAGSAEFRAPRSALWPAGRPAGEARNLQFSSFRHFCDKSNFLRGFWRIPPVEKVASDQTQLFRRGFPFIFHAEPFPSRFLLNFRLFEPATSRKTVNPPISILEISPFSLPQNSGTPPDHSASPSSYGRNETRIIFMS